MTEELKQAAQRLLAALDRADDGCKNGGLGPGYENGHGVEVGTELADARRELAALTPRPAAQTEREANATERAFVLATMAAEEFVRCNGLATGEADEFLMTGPDLTDEYATACIDHLKWVGECVAFDHDDGVLVLLGDFTLGSLS